MSNQLFKIRCSAIHSIMAAVSVATIEDLEFAKSELVAANMNQESKPNKTNAKKIEAAKRNVEKIEHALQHQSLLPTGAMSFCKHWNTAQIYGREKLEAYSKYTAKGKQGESEAIKLLSLLDGDFYMKNTERKSNEYMTGECDIFTGAKVIDIKCSWDCFTFPSYEKTAEDKYQWQILGYMNLWGVTSGEVVHVLVDAPEEIIIAETYRLAKVRDEEYSEDLEDEVRANMTYSDLPIELRVKRFPVLYDAEKIALIEKRVQLCREYIATL